MLNLRVDDGGLRVPRSCVVQTPRELANAMANSLRDNKGGLWLEPCVGTGALVRALASNGISRERIIGIDLAHEPEAADALAQVQRGVDFFSWSQSTKMRFDRVIANPPYLAIERLREPLRNAASSVFLDRDIRVTVNANTWYAFLCAAIGVLRSGASICFVLPAAWDYANYSAALRKEIVRMFGVVEVYRCHAPLFRAERIQEGVVVLVARDFHGIGTKQETARPQVTRKEFGTSSELINYLYGRGGGADDRDQGRLRSSVEVKAPAVIKTISTVPIRSQLSLGLGAVTGDSRYFLMSESERQDRALPRFSVQPVVSRARHLKGACVTRAQWMVLKNFDERVWLFSPPPRAVTHPAVRSYIRFGMNGGCNRENQKVAMRSPWYRLSMPTPIDGFVSGMSKHGPWISLCRMPDLGATNTLYVVRFRDRSASLNRRASIALNLLSSVVQEQLTTIGRRYADGLLKFEPGDLLSLNVPDIEPSRGSYAQYRRAISALLGGAVETARLFADEWLNKRS